MKPTGEFLDSSETRAGRKTWSMLPTNLHSGAYLLSVQTFKNRSRIQTKEYIPPQKNGTVDDHRKREEITAKSRNGSCTDY